MKNKTNVEAITEFMEFGSPLNQAFVMEAVRIYAEQCVNRKEELIESMKNGFIAPEAWVGCAEQWLAERKDN